MFLYDFNFEWSKFLSMFQTEIQYIYWILSILNEKLKTSINIVFHLLEDYNQHERLKIIEPLNENTISLISTLRKT